MWLPSSSLAVVNVSYSTTGQLVGLQRGSMSERTEFDSQGRILSRSFVDGKVWSYSYLDKVSTFIFSSHLGIKSYEGKAVARRNSNLDCRIE